MSKNTNNAPKFGEDRAYDSNTSPTLQNALANAPVEDIEQKIAQLRQYWVSEENLALFVWANIQTVSSLTNILEDSKGEEQEVSKQVVGLVNNELGKARIRHEKILEVYNAQRQAVYVNAANNNLKNIFWDDAENDEDRSYGWLWKAA